MIRILLESLEIYKLLPGLYSVVSPRNTDRQFLMVFICNQVCIQRSGECVPITTLIPEM